MLAQANRTDVELTVSKEESSSRNDNGKLANPMGCQDGPELDPCTKRIKCRYRLTGDVSILLRTGLFLLIL